LVFSVYLSSIYRGYISIHARGLLKFNTKGYQMDNRNIPSRDDRVENAKGSALALGAVALTGLSSVANAALTAPTLATTDFETVAGAVLVALGVMWAIKKAIGLIRP
jgi:hypothetical protein